ncbi:hypothetical protein Q0Z83_084530 [Actinoplanes sichuanensis]|nr:hypothetical protein Q0Z83_084530 [Actinoplanes sichuanensis]
MPDRGGHGEQALGDTGADAFDAAAAVQFDVELPFQGVVDRLDQLAYGFEQVLARTWGPVAVGRPWQPCPAFGEPPVEFGRDVAFAGDDQLSGPGGEETGVLFQHRGQDLTFVGFGVGQSPGDR